jgi:hypothetical protein
MASTVTTTVRVISGVHNDTTDRRADAHAAFTTSGTYFDVLVLFVAYGTDVGCAFYSETADFTARHFYHGVIAFFGSQLGAGTCGTDDLAAFARLVVEAGAGSRGPPRSPTAGRLTCSGVATAA